MKDSEQRIDPSGNPAEVAAALLGCEPLPELVAYLEELVVECEGCGKPITLSTADKAELDGARMLVTSGHCYAHIPKT